MKNAKTEIIIQVMKAIVSLNNKVISIAAVMILIMSSQLLMATSYVMFNDGRLYVFPDSCLEGYSYDNGILTFTALDGTVYSYERKDILLVSDHLKKKLPEITSFKFSKKHNYQVYTDANGEIDGDEIRVQVSGIGNWFTASFNLSHDLAKVYVDGKEQVSTQSRLRYYPSRVYTVGFPGDLILAPKPMGGYALMPYGHQYTVNVDNLTSHSSAVPRIDINTVDGVNITSKTEYVDAEIIIDGAGVFPSMTDSVKIRGRGNNSWSSNPDAKNPYRLKFAEKVKPLGMTKGKNWVLLANKLRGSMLTNAIGMRAAGMMGVIAANHIIPVDLYINGTYKGSYTFTEKVGFANNSVDLDDETTSALLELDSYYDEVYDQKFKSTPFKLPVNIKEPEFNEDSTLLTINDIKRRFNAFASAVENGEDITAHVAIDPLARYLMLNVFICNLELYHPKSTYCFYENVLDDASLLQFGPAWDLDWGFGYDGSHSYSYFENNATCDYFRTLTSSNFFSYLGNNPKVASRMYLILKDFNDTGSLNELCDFCQEYYRYAKPSFQNNKAASLDATDYAAQVTKAINWLKARYNYLMEQYSLKLGIRGDVNGDHEINIGDVSALTDILLGGYADAWTLLRADVNSDGETTVADINMLIDLIIGAD